MGAPPRPQEIGEQQAGPEAVESMGRRRKKKGTTEAGRRDEGRGRRTSKGSRDRVTLIKIVLCRPTKCYFDNFLKSFNE
jgi:hypothetical protein